MWSDLCPQEVWWLTIHGGCIAGLNFRYQDPERGFDRGKVKRMVAQLVRVNDDSIATALEVVAGGKLFQV